MTGEEATAHEGVSTLEDPAPIEERALQLLHASPGGIIAESKCKKHALLLWNRAREGRDKASNSNGKRNHMWERVRRGLQARGLIQRVMLRAEDGVKKEQVYDGDDMPAAAQEVVCIKLLDSVAGGVHEKQSSGGGIVAQVSLLEQMLRVIQRAGAAGILQSDLHRSLGIDQRIAYDQAMQLVQFFGVQPSPETVGRQTQYRLTYVGPGLGESAPARDEAEGGALPAGGMHAQGGGGGVGGGDAGISGEAGKRMLTRDWVVRQESWDRSTPCTEQWLQRANGILSKLAAAPAMTRGEVNPFLNSLDKHDRDRAKKSTHVDYKTSDRIIAQVAMSLPLSASDPPLSLFPSSLFPLPSSISFSLSPLSSSSSLSPSALSRVASSLVEPVQDPEHRCCSCWRVQV